MPELALDPPACLNPSLGVAFPSGEGPAAAPAGSFDAEFRGEIYRQIHKVLRRSYVHNSKTFRREASLRGATLEEFVAAVITQFVMQKVDEEYV